MHARGFAAGFCCNHSHIATSPRVQRATLTGEQVQKAVNEAEKVTGPVTILVPNAGVPATGSKLHPQCLFEQGAAF